MLDSIVLHGNWVCQKGKDESTGKEKLLILYPLANGFCRQNIQKCRQLGNFGGTQEIKGWYENNVNAQW